LLATLASPRFSFTAPLGTGLAALGIVGVLVASGGLPTAGGPAVDTSYQLAPGDAAAPDVPGASIGIASIDVAPATEAPTVDGAASAVPSAPNALAGGAQASVGPAGREDAPPLAQVPDGSTTSLGDGSSPAIGTVKAPAPSSEVDLSAAPATNPLLLVPGVVAIVVGVGLAGLRIASRRIG
ncbi:MAG: hypothetical protein ABIR11_02655, partial [Candidatus Limnocylindrales bacterium]